MSIRNVKSISSVVSLGENTVNEYELSYEYDANGNITHEYSGSGERIQLMFLNLDKKEIK